MGHWASKGAEDRSHTREDTLRAKLFTTNATGSRKLLEIPRSWGARGLTRPWSESHSEEGHWEGGAEGGKGLLRSHRWGTG